MDSKSEPLNSHPVEVTDSKWFTDREKRLDYCKRQNLPPEFMPWDERRERESGERVRVLRTQTPTLHIFDRKDMRSLVDIQDMREAAALAKWVEACADRSVKHSEKARSLRGVHFVLMFFSLLLSAISSVLSGVSTDKQGVSNLSLTIGALTCSALASVFVGLNGLLDPSARRSAHLLSENQYIVLGRDIAVYLAGIGSDAVRARDLDITSALKDYQRRLDNIDSVAPDI